MGPQQTIDEGDRRFTPQTGTGANQCFLAVNPGSAEKSHTLAGNPFRADILTNLHRKGAGNPDPFFHELHDLIGHRRLYSIGHIPSIDKGTGQGSG
jgi:hypothetical protein